MPIFTLAWSNGAKDEAVASEFEPDTLASYQYFDSFQRKQPLEPEKQLMESVLEDAVNIFCLYAFARCGQKKRLFWEARRWIWADDWNWPFSFQNICAVLSLDPDYLRQGLIRWQESRGKELAQTTVKREPRQLKMTGT